MDKPSFKNWLNRVASEAGRIGQDMGQAVRDAVESPTGQQVRQKLDELGPQVRKTVDDLRPEVQRVYGQVAPEVKRVAGEVARGTSRAFGELFGRPADGDIDEGEPHTPRTPPNVSPDVARGEGSSGPETVRFDVSGAPDAGHTTANTKKTPKKKTIGRKPAAKRRSPKPKA